MAETPTTTDVPEPPNSQAAEESSAELEPVDPQRSTQRVLCVIAAALVTAYVFSRHLDWATFEINAPAGGLVATPRELGIDGKEAWSALDTPLVIFGLGLIPINLVYAISRDALDALAPAIANCVVGALLTLMTLYFIFSTDSILGSSKGRSVTLSYSAASGATIALVIAAALLAVGACQLVIRLRARPETA